MLDLVRTRVAAGAALLDRRFVGWFLLIDGDELDMQSAAHCVLGQIAHHKRSTYYDLLSRLRLHSSGLAAAHGFELAINDDLWVGDSELLWGHLRWCWLGQISQRRARLMGAHGGDLGVHGRGSRESVLSGSP